MTSRSGVTRLVDEVLEATVVPSFSKIGYEVRSRIERWSDPPQASGRCVVVTGGTSGLGLATAERLARLGANVHLVGRNETKITEAVETLRRTARGTVEGHQCDLSLLAETAALAERLAATCAPIDVLVHNAGALLERFTPSGDGIETTLATHLLSPYLLTERLIGSSSFAPRARVITMTSGGMYSERFDLKKLEMTAVQYKGTVAYARVKRAQTVLVAHWQHVHGPGGLAFHLVNPGWAATPGVAESLPGFYRVMGPLLRSPAQGADTTVWLAGLPDGLPEPGQLWLDRHPRRLHRLRRTRLTSEEERSAEAELPMWCAERIGRALGHLS